MFEAIGQLGQWGWVHNTLLMLYALTIISIIVIVISENRNPVKSLAWVTVLLLLPMVGIILYLFFGRNIKNKHKLSRRNRRRLKKREAATNADYRRMELSAESTQCIKLATALTGAPLYDGNDVEVYTNGTEKFARFKEDLRRAGFYINI